MKRNTAATTLALIFASGMATAQSTGSVLSDMSDPDVIAKGRAEAAAAINCEIPESQDAQLGMFAANALSKWDRVAMDCAVKAGSAALDGIEVHSSAETVELGLNVLGAHLEYFDVLDKSYGDFYQGTEISSELHVRWEQTRASGAELLARVEPLADAVPEVLVLRAAFNLSSTVRESSVEQQNVALESALADLGRVIEENPETLGGLAQLVMAQVLMSLPEFLGGDPVTAIALLEQSRGMNPNDLSIHKSLTDAYLGERENDKAVEILKAALAVDPSTNNAQDYFDEVGFLSGLALRAGDDDLAAKLNEKREALFAAQPNLLTRKEHGGSFGHGGNDPITGKDPSAITSN